MLLILLGKLKFTSSYDIIGALTIIFIQLHCFSIQPLNQKSAQGNTLSPYATLKGRWLLARFPVWIPDAAAAWGRHVTIWNAKCIER